MEVFKANHEASWKVEGLHRLSRAGGGGSEAVTTGYFVNPQCYSFLSVAPEVFTGKKESSDEIAEKDILPEEWGKWMQSDVEGWAKIASSPAALEESEAEVPVEGAGQAQRDHRGRIVRQLKPGGNQESAPIRSLGGL